MTADPQIDFDVLELLAELDHGAAEGEASAESDDARVDPADEARDSLGEPEEDFDDEVLLLAAAIPSATPDEDVGSADGSNGAYWSEVSGYIPPEVIEYVQTICEKRWVAERVLDYADAKVCRRLRTDTLEAKRARWTNRWRPEEQERTKKLIRNAKDVELHRIHQEHVCDHETFDELPKALLGWRPIKRGELVIHDMQIKNPSIGGGSFLEQTPPKVLQWVLEHWRERAIERLPDDVGFKDQLQPALWDLTAGSGTSVDLFRTIHGCKIIASDLTVVTASGIAMADCRDVGCLDAHRGRLNGLSWPERVVRRPDVILFDPPSRGRPTHAELYGGPATGDLAELDRDEYLGAVLAVVIRALSFLARGGFVSLLLRCGSRKRGQVTPDPALLDDLKTLLDGDAAITREMPLVYASARNQASLGTARVPAVHLVIERPS